MAIELPPPLPPQQVPAPRIEPFAGRQTITFKTYRLHLPAGSPLPRDEALDAIAGTDTIDQAMSALSHAWYARGELSTRLLYGVAGDDIYVLADRRRITEVRAPADIAAYFDGLTGSALRDDSFEQRRALASVYADRAGINAHSVLRPTDDGAALVIEPDPTDGKRSSAEANFGNPGNRFVGSHFFDLDLRHSDTAGDQFKLLWHTALTGLGDGDADDYNEETLTWSRATTTGVWGVTGHAFDYSADDDRGGQLREGQLTWLYPLAASLQSRFLLEARADYVNRESDGQDVHFREEYPSVQFGAHYSYSASPRVGPLDIDVGTTFRKGLRGDTAQTGAKLDYFLWRPTASVNLSLSDNWSTGLLMAGQLTSNALPLENQWVLGGIDNVVAYRPGVVVGDSGAYATLDLQYRGWSLLGVQFTPRAFAEYGVSRYAKALDGGENHTAVLSDLGVQLKAEWRYFEASVAAAAPIEHRNVSASTRHASDTNLLFKLTARL